MLPPLRTGAAPPRSVPGRPAVTAAGGVRAGNDGWYYNFWQDETHVRGIWRRTTLDSYRTAAPEWHTVLDIDAMPPPAPDINWVWKGKTLLDEGPDGPWDRALIFLSPGGSDAKLFREFDLKAEKWITPEEGGFELKEAAKCSVRYRSRDELLIGTDFGAPPSPPARPPALPQALGDCVSGAAHPPARPLARLPSRVPDLREGGCGRRD